MTASTSSSSSAAGASPEPEAAAIPTRPEFERAVVPGRRATAAPPPRRAATPAPAAQAAASSIGAATQVSRSVPDPAALLATAQTAFTDGLSLALSVAAALALCTAVVDFALLRHAQAPLESSAPAPSMDFLIVKSAGR